MQTILGARLQFLRKEAGLTQKQLADRLNTANNTISQYENGDRTPSIETQMNIARLFGVSIDFLVGRTDDRSPRPERPSGSPPPANPAYLEALQYLDGLSDEGMASALRCLQAIKALDDVKGAAANLTIIEKNA